MRIFRKTRWILAIGAVAAVAAGVSYAAIPSANGTISACLDGKGSLKVIDVETGGSCAANTKLLTWNQQGPKGDPGPSDAYTKSGPATALLLGNTYVTSLDLPIYGKYVLTSRVWIHSFDDTYHGCMLYVGATLVDSQIVHTNSSIADVEVTLNAVTTTGGASAKVTLMCSTGGGPSGATAKNGSITAIKVANINNYV